MNYSLNTISTILKATAVGNSDLPITSVSIDSRSVSSSSSTLFFALVGQNHDGHRFISELYARGVKAFVVSREESYGERFPEASFLHVSDTLLALQQLAAYHRKRHEYPIIGITGSNGKTIVKEWLMQILSPDKNIVRSPKSYNSQVGVPLSVLNMNDNYDLGIFEAGISMPKEMDKLEPIISPDIGLFTNIGSAHQENFTDIRSKAIEKMQLFVNSKVLIYCNNSDIIDAIAKEKSKESGMQLFTWGKDEGSDVRVLGIQSAKGVTSIQVVYKTEKFQLSIPFIDEASIENSIHCLSVALYLNVSLDKIIDRMEQLQPVAMRLELKEGINGCTIIDDSYNSDLGSLSIALDYLAQQRQHSKRILIISDIFQSGTNPNELYREVASLAKEKGVDTLLGIGKVISGFANLFPSNSEFYPDYQSFEKALIRKQFSNVAILLKGSRVFQFERISALLEQKTHRTILEINLNALVYNLNYFRALLKPKVKVMAMVKAFSYGSGSYEIANLLQFHRVDYLGVAFADEGVALRDAGISLPIVVLNPAFGSYELMIDYNLEPEIFSFSSLDSFIAIASKRGVTSYPIHIKIDTGMHRLGFLPNEIDGLAQRINSSDCLKVQSVFSHMVGSDEQEHDDFSKFQISVFEDASNRISQLIGYKPLQHILNSVGIERFPQAQFDMVRLGIGLYGVSAIHENKLMKVSTLKSFIAQLRELPGGETVGYNRKGKVICPSKIATIPIGYADGLNRRLSNGVGYMLVNGVLAPIIGNVSMDTSMIDVTHVPNVQEGDEVIVFGENPTISQMAKQLGTISYEVLTSISRRVKRVYIQE